MKNREKQRTSAKKTEDRAVGDKADEAPKHEVPRKAAKASPADADDVDRAEEEEEGQEEGGEDEDEDEDRARALKNKREDDDDEEDDVVLPAPKPGEADAPLTPPTHAQETWARRLVGAGATLSAFGLALVGIGPSDVGRVVTLVGVLVLVVGIHRFGRLGPLTAREAAPRD